MIGDTFESNAPDVNQTFARQIQNETSTSHSVS